jgi:hypothetical protein
MDNAALRRAVYTLLTVLTVGITVARIVGAELVYEPSIASRPWPKDRPEKMPTYGSNDRSRWATVRALVEHGTFVIGERVKVDRDALALAVGGAGAANDKGFRDVGVVFTDGYKTVDAVKNPETDRFYSSKPPLFTTIVAGEYWLLRTGLGWTLEKSEFRWPVVCTVLVTVNVLPLLALLILLARLLEEYGTTDWGRLFVFAAACFGTFLTTFATTLNNHTPAACCVMAAAYPLLRGRAADPARPFTGSELLVAGFFAGLAATCDLTAAAFTAAAGLVVLLRSPRGLVLFVPAALVPVGALVALNAAVFGSVVPVYSKKNTEWYKYPGSHWLKLDQKPPPAGIDFADEPKEVYAFHMLLGHHGLFSLTPVWLLSLWGAARTLRGPSPPLRALGAVTLLTTAVVCGFYIVSTNNYEGWTSGPRWAFWLTPLLLLALLPAADVLAGARGGRGLALLFLAASVFTAAYPAWNPWRHPWPYVLCEYMNWVKY